MGRTAEAVALLRQVVAANPRRVDDSLLLGELLMRSGDYPGALNYFRRAEQMQPATRSEVLLALCYQRLKQFDQANRYLEMAKHRSPDNPEVQRSLAGFFLETGNYEEAIAALKAIRKPRPDVMAELAYAYQLAGKPAESARLYAQAANAMPKDLVLQLSAAQAQVTLGALDKADHFLNRAEQLDRDHYRLHAIRGEIARLQDRDEDAVKEYQAVLAHMPANPSEGPLYGIQIHMNLMELYQGLKQTDTAREQLDIAQKQISALNESGPGRLPFLRLRASIKMHLNDLDGAGRDVKEALAINPKDPNTLQLDGDLLMKLGRTEEAINAYNQILEIDPKNRFALTSLGYASRTAGRDADAEKYFRRLAEVNPTLYVPYAALGDMYTARRDFAKAETNYSKAYRLAPKNAAIVAGGMNAAIEAHKMDLAGVWASRATEAMQQDPQVLREEERYLSFKGDYKQSAAIGEKVIKMLPKDRDVVVYLGYDLLNLQRYDELLKLTSEYTDVLTKEPDLPLFAGYVHKHNGELEEARQDFTKALERDPNVVTAYVNRGYVLHDLRESKAAASDFEAAIQRDPNNGEAHLGLAYANLDLRKSSLALKESQLAEKILGDSEQIHLIRGTAYGQRGQPLKAASEYRLALKFSPDDPSLHLALAGVLYSARLYHDSIEELGITQKLAPTDANVYALLARAYAQLGDREQTLRNVQLAEQNAQLMQPKHNKPGSGPSSIYLSTGSALSVLGDQAGAMERFRKALTMPDSDRIDVRLAIAQIMVHEGRADDARRQIALAMMEAEAGVTEPATGEQLVQTADVLRGVHDFDLSQTYLQRARAVGASDTAVRIGMANNYMAVGDTVRAQGELAGISQDADSDPDYRLLLAQANVDRQLHHNTQALTAFAQAADAAGEDPTAQQGMLMAGGDEGLRIHPRVSLLSDFSVSGIFEPTTVYVLDSKLDTTTPVPESEPSLASTTPFLATDAGGRRLPPASQLPANSGRLLSGQKCPRSHIRTECELNSESRHDGLFTEFRIESYGSPGDEHVELQYWCPGNNSPGFDPAESVGSESISLLYVYDYQFLFRCGFGQRVFHIRKGSVYRIRPAFADTGWRRGLPGWAAVGKNCAGNRMGLRRSTVPAGKYRELLHVLVRWVRTAILGQVEREGSGRRSALLANCADSLRNCAGSCTGRHGSIPADAELDGAGIDRVQQYARFPRLRRRAKRFFRLICDGVPSRVQQRGSGDSAAVSHPFLRGHATRVLLQFSG